MSIFAKHQRTMCLSMVWATGVVQTDAGKKILYNKLESHEQIAGDYARSRRGGGD